MPFGGILFTAASEKAPRLSATIDDNDDYYDDQNDDDVAAGAIRRYRS